MTDPSSKALDASRETGWVASLSRDLVLGEPGLERILRERAASSDGSVSSETIEEVYAQRTLLEAISRLQPRHRTFLHLHYVTGRPRNADGPNADSSKEEALRALRERLDADHEGMRSVWLEIVVPIALGLDDLLWMLPKKKPRRRGWWAVLLLAALGWWWMPHSDDSVADGPLAGTSWALEPLPEPPPHPPPLPIARTPIPRPSTSGGGSVDSSRRSRRTKELVERGWNLRGRLTGLSPRVPWSSAVEVVVARGQTALDVPVDDSGRFASSLAEFLIDAPLATRVTVRVNDPWYLPEERTVDVSFDVDERGLTFPEDVDVTIPVRAAGSTEGYVTDESGNPLEGATVAIFLGGSGTVDSEPLDEVQSSQGGRYFLRSPHEGNHLVVATHAPIEESEARLRWFRPASGPLPITIGHTTFAPPLALGPGATAEGWVGLPSGEPLGSARVRAEARIAGSELFIGGTSYIFHNGAIEALSVTATCDDFGAFRLGGLASESHHFRVVGLKDRVLHPSVANKSTSSGVPVQGLHLVVPCSWLTLQAREFAGGLEEVEIVLRGAGGTATWHTGKDGLLEVAVAASETYELSARLKGFDEASQAFVAAPPAWKHTEIVDMIRRGPPLLRLRLLGLPPHAIETITLKLQRDGRGVATLLSGAENLFEYEDPDPGRFTGTVEIGSLRHPLTHEEHYCLATTFEVEIPTNGPVDVTLPLRMGGRIGFVQEGKVRRGVATVLDPDQAEVFKGRLEDRPLLPPGKYRVRFELAGSKPFTRRVEVIEEEVSLVPVRPKGSKPVRAPKKPR